MREKTRIIETVLAAVVVTASAGGCNVRGNWKRVATDPPQAMFPLDRLALGDDHHYTAEWKHKGRKLGSTGTYRYRGGTLSIAESGRVPRDYNARVRLDGRLELTYTINGNHVTAILERDPRRDPKPPTTSPPRPPGDAPSGSTYGGATQGSATP